MVFGVNIHKTSTSNNPSVLPKPFNSFRLWTDNYGTYTSDWTSMTSNIIGSHLYCDQTSLMSNLMHHIWLESEYWLKFWSVCHTKLLYHFSTLSKLEYFHGIFIWCSWCKADVITMSIVWKRAPWWFLYFHSIAVFFWLQKLTIDMHIDTKESW